ncbi:MAG: hypothetical protein JWO31_2700, partial [Phycisphaerales bacterium]|nr:hypothetical protein [Phycisphaerales bacterium]
RPHRMADTERGKDIKRQIELLEQLVDAYNDNRLRQRAGTQQLL